MQELRMGAVRTMRAHGIRASEQPTRELEACILPHTRCGPQLLTYSEALSFKDGVSHLVAGFWTSSRGTRGLNARLLHMGGWLVPLRRMVSTIKQ